MKILIAHNYYQQPGGEDQVFSTEADLLEAHSHQVLRYPVHNSSIEGMNPIALAGATIWSTSGYRELRALIRQKRPQVAHFHNTLPLISPAAYYAARAERVPVVQTLHNYRLLCPSAVFFRDGKVCEDCLGKFVPWPGVIHACYRANYAASGAVATMLILHRTLRTWTNLVDQYIALTEFARQKFIQGGLPAEKIVVKPNFIQHDSEHREELEKYALFVGRLSPEKGISTLLKAWQQIGEKMPLKIVGDGPLAPQVLESSRRVPGIDWLQQLPKEQVLALMERACILILPSLWYEGFPMVIAEAFASGLPVVASGLGSLSSLIDHQRTGLHFQPGSPEDLATQVEWVLAHPMELIQMRQAARTEFEAKYTAKQNYQMLIEIYEKVVGDKFSKATTNLEN